MNTSVSVNYNKKKFSKVLSDEHIGYEYLILKEEYNKFFFAVGTKLKGSYSSKQEAQDAAIDFIMLNAPKDNAYFYQLAIDHFGMDIRDNSKEQKISIGKAIEAGSLELELY